MRTARRGGGTEGRGAGRGHKEGLADDGEIAGESRKGSSWEGVWEVEENGDVGGWRG